MHTALSSELELAGYGSILASRNLEYSEIAHSLDHIYNSIMYRLAAARISAAYSELLGGVQPRKIR